MTNLLASALRTILATTPADVIPVLYLCTNRIAPAHEGIELGIGDAILMKVRASETCLQPKFPIDMDSCFISHDTPLSSNMAGCSSDITWTLEM